MRSICPINDLLKYIKEATENSNTILPISLIKHAKNCESCKAIISNPDDWESFINIHERLTNNHLDNQKIHNELSERQVCRIKIPNSSNSAFVLITDISNLNSEGFIRVSPIAVSPIEENIDETTDVIIPANRMPTGLPSLIEWWNDRPVLAENINKIFGSISKEDYSNVKDKLTNEPEIKNPTKSILMFREIEKNKGNTISGSFFEKVLTNEQMLSKDESKRDVIVFKKPKSKQIIINCYDLFPANEDLKMAAASNDVYTTLKEYLNNNYSNNYEVTKIDDGSNSFTISSINNKKFTLTITYKDKNIKEMNSNLRGKLYLKEGLENFEKIEFKE